MDAPPAGCTEESGFSKAADGNNHLAGFTYDTSGNTQNDGAYTYTWDGESQLKSAGGVTYLYDGDGRRVAKVGSKLYWYGAGGEILAETNSSGTTQNEYIFFGGKRIAEVPASGSPIYYVEDLLGTSRLITTNAGGVCYDADFYPYGGERPYTNTCTQNYKFEGKERDTETGNDDFGARYYSNRFGRWLSADWSSVPVAVPYANLTNPQTLNLYSMVADDPESFADLDGHVQQGAGDLYPDLGPQGGTVCETAGKTCPGDVQNAQSEQQATAASPHSQTYSNIVTGAWYKGESATVAFSQETVVSTNADGSTTSTTTRTSSFFSNEPGQEGKYLGSSQSQLTMTVDNSKGNVAYTSTKPTEISQKDAQAIIGRKEFRAAQGLAAEPDRAAYFARATMADVRKNPAKYVAASASVAAKVCPNPLCRAAFGAVAAAAGAYQAYKTAATPPSQ